MSKKLSWFCLIAFFAIILMAPAAQAGKANDTLNILHYVELSSVDNYFNTDRWGWFCATSSGTACSTATSDGGIQTEPGHFLEIRGQQDHGIRPPPGGEVSQRRRV